MIFEPGENTFVNQKVMVKIQFFLALLFCSCASSQDKAIPKLVGGPCEGCEAIFEYGERPLLSIDTLPDFNSAGPKVKMTGTVYQPDGKTPAADVIIYIYHTDQAGVYAKNGDETGWAKRHGYIRGWAKTGADGTYSFYTLKPGAYPERSTPAHIHPTILEPNGKYYWLHAIHFEGDPLLEPSDIPVDPRGGIPTVISLKMEDSIWVAKCDIILGKNIPSYQ